MNSINLKVYSKRWKQVVTIAYLDNYGFAVDTVGIQHDKHSLRATRGTDFPVLSQDSDKVLEQLDVAIEEHNNS